MGKFYFKALSKNCSGEYLSAMAYDIPKKYCLTYELGKTTIPIIGRIFVFATLEYAVYFAECNSTDVAAICKGTATEVGKPKFLCPSFGVEHHLVQFWNRNIVRRRVCPIGTLSCGSFTPTEIVWKKLS